MKAALDADDEAFLRELDAERGLFAQMGDTLKGPLGGWSTLTFVMALPLSAIMFLAIWKMFTVQGTRELVLWTAGALAGERDEWAVPATMELDTDPVVGLYQMCAASPLGPFDRQRLLCAATPEERALELDRLLAELVDVLRDRLGGS